MTWLDYLLIATLIGLLYIIKYLVEQRGVTERRLNQAKDEATRLITRGTNARAQIDEDRHRFAEALGEAFVMIGPTGNIMLANSYAHALFNESKMEGVPLQKLSRNPALLEHVHRALAQRAPVSVEFTLAAPAGDMLSSTAWHLDYVETKGDVPEKRLLIRNITNTYLNAQARKDFVANASHELRTPLTIIKGYLENIAEDGFVESSPELAQKFSLTMLEHTNRIIQLVDDMLMVSKLESNNGSPTLKEDTFCLESCVHDVFSRLEPIREKHAATLRTEIHLDGKMLYGDLFYWTQIFFNLIENALKQNPSTPIAVTVTARITSSHCVICVADNGCGISVAAIPFIFNRFYRADTQHSSKIKGTGLGLSIVRRAVETHGGTIMAESIPNVATTFTISLPLTRLHDPL